MNNPYLIQARKLSIQELERHIDKYNIFSPTFKPDTDTFLGACALAYKEKLKLTFVNSYHDHTT